MNDNERILSLLSYINFLFIVPLIALPNSAYARYHANQGCVLFIAEIVAGIALKIIKPIFVFLPFIGWAIFTMLSAAVGITTLVLTIIGIVNAVKGRMEPLPIIGNIKIIN